MATYVWSLTAEVNENSVATRWAEGHKATLVPTTTSRRKQFLSKTTSNDLVLIVAHGSATELGTKGDAVIYSPATLATELVTGMGMNDGVKVVLAACDSDAFAATLQTKIRAMPLHGKVVCTGQAGKFAFSQDFKP